MEIVYRSPVRPKPAPSCATNVMSVDPGYSNFPPSFNTFSCENEQSPFRTTTTKKKYDGTCEKDWEYERPQKRMRKAESSFEVTFQSWAPPASITNNISKLPKNCQMECKTNKDRHYHKSNDEKPAGVIPWWKQYKKSKKSSSDNMEMDTSNNNPANKSFTTTSSTQSCHLCMNNQDAGLSSSSQRQQTTILSFFASPKVNSAKQSNLTSTISRHNKSSLLSSRSCHFCEQPTCKDCLRQCEVCHESFCSVCSNINYDSSMEKVFCLDCASDFHNRNDGMKID